jgi:hypothetical protein
MKLSKEWPENARFSGRNSTLILGGIGKMKRFWLVFLLLGLFTVFSTSAFAVDVKFSGEFIAGGMYWDKTSLTNSTNISTAFYFQRLRLQTEFVVAPGLSLITRADVMERAWGAARSTGTSTTQALDSAGTVAENENIAFDWAYIKYVSPIGTFSIGEMEDGRTGTVFGDSYVTAGRIKYSLPIGSSWILNAAYTKVKDASYTAKYAATATDADNDKYGIEAIYQWKDGRAGLNVNYYRYANYRITDNYTRAYFVFTPYAVAKIGPVALQAEFNYAIGDYKDNDAGINDVKLENYSGWLDATATFAPVYFGATFAYVSGDNPNTTDKNEGGILNGGRDWSPTLIMYNYDRAMWLGELASSATTGSGFGTSGLTNGFLYQGRIGVRPTDKWDIMASVTYAAVDKKPRVGMVPGGAEYIGSSYGWEADLVVTYKITNNLSYMLGLGYLWTGDYFKGTNSANLVQDDFLVTNKLTLTF